MGSPEAASVVERLRRLPEQSYIEDDGFGAPFVEVPASDLQALLAVVEVAQKYRDGLPEEIVFALQDLEPETKEEP